MSTASMSVDCQPCIKKSRMVNVDQENSSGRCRQHMMFLNETDTKSMLQESDHTLEGYKTIFQLREENTDKLRLILSSMSTAALLSVQVDQQKSAVVEVNQQKRAVWSTSTKKRAVWSTVDVDDCLFLFDSRQPISSRPFFCSL